MDSIEKEIQDGFLRDKLRKARKSKGLTQQEAAALAGISTSTVSCIESGNGDYMSSSLLKYADALGYEVSIHKKGGPIVDTEEPKE